MSNISRRNFIGAAGLAAASISLRADDKPDLDGYVRGILAMAISDCTAAFETLPIVENIDILRNILYSGIWFKFEEKFRKRTEAAQARVTSTERTAQDE